MLRRARVSDTSNRILAVKLVREMTGFGLKESLDLVDGKAWFSIDIPDTGLGVILGEARRGGVTLEFDQPPDELSSLNAFTFAIGVNGDYAIRYRSGPNKIAAIKLTREVSPMLGLKEAKDLVEGEGLVRTGVSSSEAQRIAGLFREIGSTVTIEQAGAQAPPPSLPVPSVPPSNSSKPTATAKPATAAKPARPATHVYGRPADDDDF